MSINSKKHSFQTTETDAIDVLIKKTEPNPSAALKKYVYGWLAEQKITNSGTAFADNVPKAMEAYKKSNLMWIGVGVLLGTAVVGGGGYAYYKMRNKESN